MDASGALTDHVYAALLGESSWQAFLDRFQQSLPNGKTFLAFHDVHGMGAVQLYSGIAYNSYYAPKNPWTPSATTRPVGKVVRLQ